MSSLRHRIKGFSLPELLIAIAIFTFLSMTTILSYNNFNNRIGVDILAHQIAQFGHEAQVSALSVKRSVSGSAVYPGYGVHFERATPTKFVFFADLDGDSKYTRGTGNCGGLSDECEKTIGLLKGVTISALCGTAMNNATTSPDCIAVGATNNAATFDFLFKRPNPDANITGTTTTAVGGTNESYSNAQVIITSAKGYKRTVEFWGSGQIAVK